MAKEPKTRPREGKVDDFLAGVADPQRREDAQALSSLITEVTGEAPQMWGAAIVGWGIRTVVYAGGRTEDWLRLGFSPRKAELALYGLRGSEEADSDLTGLGKFKTGKGCLWIKHLSDVDISVLRELVRKAWS